MRAAKVWVIFSIGVGAGTAVALIYGPRIGVKTCRWLRRELGGAGDHFRDTISDRAEKYLKRGKLLANVAAETAAATYRAARDASPM